jgi:hypothetical protein
MISILEFIIIHVLCIAVARMSIHVPFQRGTVGQTAVFLLLASVLELFFSCSYIPTMKLGRAFIGYSALIANQMVYFAAYGQDER